jgi:hypothetical protein
MKKSLSADGNQTKIARLVVFIITETAISG